MFNNVKEESRAVNKNNRITVQQAIMESWFDDVKHIVQRCYKPFREIDANSRTYSYAVNNCKNGGVDNLIGVAALKSEATHSEDQVDQPFSWNVMCRQPTVPVSINGQNTTVSEDEKKQMRMVQEAQFAAYQRSNSNWSVHMEECKNAGNAQQPMFFPPNSNNGIPQQNQKTAAGGFAQFNLGKQGLNPNAPA